MLPDAAAPLVLTRSATPAADLLSAWLIKTFGSVAMPGYSHLLDEERDHTAALKAAGRSIGAIAKAVGRAKSTVSRELRRTALPRGRSSPLHAAGAYQRRRRRDAVLERDRRLRDFVCDRLAKDGHRSRSPAGSRPAMSAPCAPWGSKPSPPSSIAPLARARNCGAI